MLSMFSFWDGLDRKFPPSGKRQSEPERPASAMARGQTGQNWSKLGAFPE